MDRRAFARRLRDVCAVGAQAALTLPFALSACASYRIFPGVDKEGLLWLNLSDFGDGSGVFVSSLHLDRPVYVHRAADGALSAVLARCTHRGCLPEPEGDRLVCPCHGSEFSQTGELLQGPAERPLTRFRVSVSSDAVIIHLNERSG